MSRGSNLIDLTGKRFGRLLVIERSPNKGNSRGARWWCQCDCGNLKSISCKSLKTGRVISCGCYNKEKATTHGMTNSSEYNSWQSMLNRCENENKDNYDMYGGRGISICDEWHKFDSFYKDMGSKPSPEYSLERIDNNGNYCLENCRWTTTKEQARNRRSNRYLTFNGETLCVAEWEDRMGFVRGCIHDRLERGWSTEQAITIKPGSKKINHNSHSKLTKENVREIRDLRESSGITMRELSEKFGVCQSAIHNIVHRITWAWLD